MYREEKEGGREGGGKNWAMEDQLAVILSILKLFYKVEYLLSTN